MFVCLIITQEPLDGYTLNRIRELGRNTGMLLAWLPRVPKLAIYAIKLFVAYMLIYVSNASQTDRYFTSQFVQKYFFFSKFDYIYILADCLICVTVLKSLVKKVETENVGLVKSFEGLNIENIEGSLIIDEYW